MQSSLSLPERTNGNRVYANVTKDLPAVKLSPSSRTFRLSVAILVPCVLYPFSLLPLP